MQSKRTEYVLYSVQCTLYINLCTSKKFLKTSQNLGFLKKFFYPPPQGPPVYLHIHSYQINHNFDK